MNIFRKLRWKLTLNYTIVTVCAFLVILLLLGGILLPRLFVPNNILSPEGLITNIQQNNLPLWSHVLSQSPVDIELVKLLLGDPLGDPSATITNMNFLRVGSMQFSVSTVAAIRVFVVGADGVLKGITGHVEPTNLVVGQPFNPSIYQELEAPFTAAMNGETDLKLLYSIFEPNRRFLLAIPVFNANTGKESQVVGVIIVILDAFPTQGDIPVNILHIAWRSSLIFLLGAGIMGAVFGTFFANGLSTRFKRLFTAIDAWSAGDFSIFISDNTGDEITQFSQRLNNMAQQLQDLLRRRQEMAVSEERNRLARDLHDSAKQQALAASFQLGTALTLYESDPQKAKKHLMEADALVDKVRNELTNLVHELRPLELEEKDFSEILRDYVMEWSQRSGIESTININGNDEASLEAREAMFRIAQEALANVLRHSSTSAIELSIKFKDDSVTMLIKDDGCGFDVQAQHSGLGLTSMQQRAQALSGSFVIDSATGQGTQIMVTLPVKK